MITATPHTPRLLYIVIPVLAFFFISCSTSRNPDIERGTGYNFKAGFPEFRTSAYGFIDEDEGPMLNIETEIVKNSLIFKKDGDSLSASYALELQVQDINNSDNVVTSKRLEDKITAPTDDFIDSREALTLEYILPVDPGQYRVVAHITDLNSDKNMAQTVETTIPDIETGDYSLSNIQMYGKEKGQEEWETINTYDVKGSVDSLRFIFQVITDQSEQPMQVNSRLLRFESDTSYTRPMHFSNFSPSSIEYKGIDYDEEEEIQSSQRTLNDYGSTFIEYKFPHQQRGNYRFEVNAQRGEQEEAYKARAFGVKSENYPTINTAREMARPLVYLMGEGDHEDLMEHSNPDTLKKEVDRYWLKTIGSSSKAREVIEMYYQRVEEANKQFANFKEGWKTDLGMIYILFGAPWYTEDRLKQLTWYYSYNHSDPEYSYRFEQPKMNNRYYPFNHYLLQRHNNYYTVQYMQRELWLTGQILTRQI